MSYTGKTVFNVLHLFSGIGGGSLGFSYARSEYKGVVGRFKNILGIDVDPQICQDYERITGSPAACMDLFSREQYIKFHGHEPPEDWKEVTPSDIRDACGGEYPDVVFTSPPCKGFSGLLPEKSAKTKKYEALNQLTVRGIRLVLEAFEDNLPSLILLENVPRITSRGKKLLEEIKSLLQKAGYVTNDESHDCGEIGALAQHRKRYLLIARNEKKMPSFVYRPERQRVKSIGEVLGTLPLPGEPLAGPLHRLPKLQWKTWVRLALIPAGGDWRDLEKIDWPKYRIAHVPRKGAMSVSDWNEPSGTITGAAGYGRSNGTQAVSDPRLPEREGRHPGVYQIVSFDEPSPCVTGTRFGSGAPAISDPRTGFAEGTHTAIYRVLKYDGPANTVTGAMRPNNGAISIADPRIGCQPRSGTYGVMSWNEPAKTIIGAGDIHAGAAAVADPRIPEDTESGVFVIVAEDGTWHRPLTTLELAALQGFPMQLADGSPFELTGNSDARWRERIGNAVPPQAAQAIGEVMLAALMPSQEGIWTMGFTDIWVAPGQKEENQEFEMVH
ncbi:DNA cytosine methyltransferase [Aneurinibacillus thermoaerophilus]|uniref:DNA cytosine methyltransferase n=1 Tax=Aneurinibacillus thermoaerophilus TaxID=143495 RepID=UPI002E2496D6|nr:DNA cytosine methyltransferase [Aneurinibacillus thermoaerophilus]MED0738795.1 DNA cytosine methyltransferase [Aneurinibacillus thermoaerophilus]